MAIYKLSPNAEEDLYRIWLYGVHKFGVNQADKYYHAFFQQFDLIAQDPLIYPAVDYIKKGYRRGVSGVDSIYYRINGDIVEIIAIIGRQDVYSKL